MWSAVVTHSLTTNQITNVIDILACWPVGMGLEFRWVKLEVHTELHAFFMDLCLPCTAEPLFLRSTLSLTFSTPLSRSVNDNQPWTLRRRPFISSFPSCMHVWAPAIVINHGLFKVETGQEYNYNRCVTSEDSWKKIIGLEIKWNNFISSLLSGEELTDCDAFSHHINCLLGVVGSRSVPTFV